MERKPDLDAELSRALYRMMRAIRLAELRVVAIYPSDKIQSPVHLSIGQEAVATGVAAAMNPVDRIFATYRGHAVYLAKGGSMRGMFAELYAKATGCAGGKGGSMHLVAPDKGLVGCSAIVAATIPIATGDALASARRGRDWVSIAFFGDGAFGEGVVYESFNFAALHCLPVLYVCENNELAVHSPIRSRHRNTDLWQHGPPLGVQGRRLDGNDVLAVHAETSAALARIRAGGPPELLEFTTNRWQEHVGPGSDLHEAYRRGTPRVNTPEVDPIERFRAELVKAGVVTDADFASWDTAIEAEIEDAVAFAESSPFPDPDALLTDVYA